MTARTVMARDMTTGKGMEVPLADLHAQGDRYRPLVWDERAGQFEAVTRSEAARGLFRYAETERPGSPARGERTRQAIELAGDDLPYNRRLRRDARS